MVIAIHHLRREKKGSNLSTSLKEISLESGSGETSRVDSSITRVDSGVGFVCTMAEIGCNWARIGPSKSSQSLSIAHKWAVEID
ncbi:hypothetical protein Tco_1050141 [Tanacetum coccineum]